MSDARWYAVWPDPRSRSRAIESWKSSIFKCYLQCHLQWELATDHRFINYGTISTYVRVGFLVFILVFVSSDFELGRNISCEELTVSPTRGYFITYVHFSECVGHQMTLHMYICDLITCTLSGEKAWIVAASSCYVNEMPLCEGKWFEVKSFKMMFERPRWWRPAHLESK